MKKDTFTLIELLTVISIIVLLIGISVPVYLKVKDKARKAETKVQINQLRIALESYEATYDFLPFTPSIDVDVLVNDPGDISGDGYEDLIITLAGTDLATNPRRQQYLSLQIPGVFTDAWGEDLFVALDLDGDGSIGSAKIYGDGDVVATYVIWSKGKDTQHSSTDDDSTNQDNLKSWTR